MPTHFTVELTSKTPYQPIAGNAYCVWTYHVSWAGKGPRPKGRIALVFSADLDIKDPAGYPDVSKIQTTKIDKPAGGDTQYIFQDLDVASSGSEADLSFLAPCEENSFTPLQLATQLPGAADWNSLSFSTEMGGPASVTQIARGPAIVAPSSTPVTTAGPLTGSGRRVPKATLVSFQFEPPRQGVGGAIPKFGFVNQLRLQPGEVDAVRNPGHGNADGQPLVGGLIKADDPLWSTLKSFEGSPIPSQLPSPTVFASVQAPTLKAFGQALTAVRQQVVSRLKELPQDVPAAQVAAKPDLAIAINQLNAGVVAGHVFDQAFAVTPIGMLNLERIEMTPVGIERGELIATIPLAPLEETAVVHKEWSVTSKEFTSIVTDSLENYSETGVTENTELAQATTVQTTHANQFNVNGTVTGTFGPVTATVSSSFAAQNQNSDSANESRKHAITTTRKASTRVKQEHKVTISTTTVTGTSETSTRVLKNPSATDPIRIDYFSIMRKWHVGLYRYGLRLTYDLAIPEPGAAMRKIYADLAGLRSRLGPFVFNVAHSDITADTRAGEAQPHYLVLAERYSAQVPLPPAPLPDVQVTVTAPNTDGAQVFALPDLNIPDGYWITNLFLQYHSESKTGVKYKFRILGSAMPEINEDQGDHGSDLPAGGDLTADVNGKFQWHASGRIVVSCRLEDNRQTWVSLRAVIAPTAQTKAQWQIDVWNALYNAAQTQYYAGQQDIQSQIATLEDKLNNVDTLTLRREENEEIMKGVLRWLLGPNFHFMPDDVVLQFLSQTPIPVVNPNGDIDIIHGTVLDATRGDGLNVTAQGWAPMFQYQEMVKFINEAIEWENVLYFLYAYFWDVAPSWDFIRQLRHPDSTRQAFLRSGSARVVLTVRKGWEEAWTTFVETGGFSRELLGDHPYLAIAEEIRNYDETNYPGIPPANPGGGPLPDSGESTATQSSDALAISANPVTIEVKSSAGFIKGYTAILDSWDTMVVVGGVSVSAQEKQVITEIPDTTHITVERVEKPHDGSKRPFPIMQAGEKGQLIAEWFEYTPTSGTDIAVTSNLATLAG